MFGTKKRKELEQLKNEINQLKLHLEENKKEKENLLTLKEIMEDKSPKVDISDLYIFSNRGIQYIVKYEKEEIIGLDINGKKARGYKNTLTDIFNKRVVYDEASKTTLERKFCIIDRTDIHNDDKNYIVYLTPILEVEPDLLAYTDRQVPLYVLQQLFYKLNNVDTKNPILQKQKKDNLKSKSQEKF